MSPGTSSPVMREQHFLQQNHSLQIHGWQVLDLVPSRPATPTPLRDPGAQTAKVE